jgi:hypothetical protein
VRDHNGQQLAYVYFEDEPGQRSAANANFYSKHSVTAILYHLGAIEFNAGTGKTQLRPSGRLR